jgi:hypothetical protein
MEFIAFNDANLNNSVPEIFRIYIMHHKPQITFLLFLKPSHSVYIKTIKKKNREKNKAQFLFII